MAAIDKIYVDSFEKYKLFKDWCMTQPKLKDKYGKETSLIDYVFKARDATTYIGNQLSDSQQVRLAMAAIKKLFNELNNKENE